jgi:hypothetical protein
MRRWSILSPRKSSLAAPCSTAKTSAPARSKPSEGKIEIIRHDAALRSAWARGDLQPGNIVVIDSLRSNPEQLYASSAGKDKDILRDEKALDSIVRRMRVMNLTTGESDKGWMGEFNKTLRARMMDRTRSRGFWAYETGLPILGADKMCV